MSEQARAIWRALAEPAVRWTTAFVVASTVAVHVPYELLQPWLAALADRLDRRALDVAAAPAIAGAATAVIAAVAAAASPHGPRLAARFGAHRVLLGTGALLVAVTGAMAWIHPLVLVPMLLRSVPSALASPVVAAILHPRLDSSVRATFLSAVSLAGRLAFALALALGARAVGAHAGGTPAGWTPNAIADLAMLGVGFGAAAYGALHLLPSGITDPRPR
jgi:hypothetical protein